MSSHVKLLGVLHIIFGSLGLLVGGLALLFFGGLAGLAGMSSDDSFFAVPLLGGIGVVIFGAMLFLSLPGMIAGVGLLTMKPWARTLTIVLSAFELLHFPFGTILGIYGLWVLLNSETERLFRV